VVLLLLICALAGLNYLLAPGRILLGFYVLPTVYAAYFRSRIQAMGTALTCIVLVILLENLNPHLFEAPAWGRRIGYPWYDIAAWGAALLIIAWVTGTLRKQLHETYKGVFFILQRFIAHDEYTYFHSVHVVAYADRIAGSMGLDAERRENVMAAAMLHDIGKRETSRELLYKAARHTEAEHTEMMKHVQRGADLLHPLRAVLGRVIPIIKAHHDRFDGSGFHPTQGEEIPLEARIISVADAYDAMTSDRAHAKAVPPAEARQEIAQRSGTDFDPAVVEAFLAAYDSGALEIDFTSLYKGRP
jgi:putative nucleotidyltransferase with HDIG domain